MLNHKIITNIFVLLRNAQILKNKMDHIKYFFFLYNDIKKVIADANNHLYNFQFRPMDFFATQFGKILTEHSMCRYV